jgi:transcriptional regulator with XRE-family HTH domain
MENFLIIRDLCEKRKITIRKLAMKVGIRDVTVHHLIKKGSTNTATLEKIAQILDVPVGVFFDDTLSKAIHQTGKGNIVGNSNRVMISDCESKLEISQNKIESLEALLEEKERTIQILMNKN